MEPMSSMFLVLMTPVVLRPGLGSIISTVEPVYAIVDPCILGLVFGSVCPMVVVSVICVGCGQD